MSRFIDTLPTPEKAMEKKIFCISRSRTGTHSFYSAIKKLGYTPYHMFEVLDYPDETHLKILNEALRCKFCNDGTKKPYGKAEFDKWFANYDVVIEFPAFFVDEIVQFYPDAKYILVERDLGAWERSARQTIKNAVTITKSFPFNVLRWLDPWINAFVTFAATYDEVLFHGKGFEAGLEDAHRDAAIVRETAMKMIPENQFLYAKLEDGFGWEQLCPFLGKDIPKEPYNHGNTAEDFNRKNEEAAGPHVKKAIMKLAAIVAVPLAGIGMWFAT